MLKQIDLKTARQSAKMYAHEVAERLNKTQAWLGMIENGKRRISAEDLIEIMTIYGLDDLKLNEIFLPKKTTKSSRKQHNKK